MSISSRFAPTGTLNIRLALVFVPLIAVLPSAKMSDPDHNTRVIAFALPSIISTSALIAYILPASRYLLIPSLACVLLVPIADSVFFSTPINPVSKLGRTGSASLPGAPAAPGLPVVAAINSLSSLRLSRTSSAVGIRCRRTKSRRTSILASIVSLSSSRCSSGLLLCSLPIASRMRAAVVVTIIFVCQFLRVEACTV